MLEGRYPLVCWVSFVEGRRGIWCQLLDALGELLGGNFLLSNLTLAAFYYDEGCLDIVDYTLTRHNSLWYLGDQRVVLMSVNVSFDGMNSVPLALNFSVDIVLP